MFPPLAGRNYGPFMSLFQTDFRAGVTVLNRLLNHATLIRARQLARPHDMSHGLLDTDIGQYRADLKISGERRLYVGDQYVWMMYRGTGVGPYPCISALLALEMVCDQLIRADIPIRDLVSVLLDGCENLAMVGLIVGVLVRHLEDAGDLLDPYLTEPLIWNYEFARVALEHSISAASSEGIDAPQRRTWSLREAAMSMALRSEEDRASDLRVLGEKLVQRMTPQGQQACATEGKAKDGDGIERQLAEVRGWASSLDRSNYKVSETPEGLYVQHVPPGEVVQALQHGNRDLERTAEEIRLTARYLINPNKAYADTDELTADIASARKLLENPPSSDPYGPWDATALVAATALDAYLLRLVDVPG